VCCNPSLVEEQNLKNIHILVYKNGIQIDFGNLLFEKADILVVNNLGQMIAKENIFYYQKTHRIELSQNGVYFVIITVKTRKKSKTIVKEIVAN